ncbi:hypothetical protein DYD21_13305 [Rhodohalobacter sp. SW132]|uniref:UbiA family prenyltransferase n=1 Tax=Rhodohalobacter sp. SW132 TaxID=2293433 RepID=UPI000E251AFB|nr:UbiA family prenyltransferase [Rhodohalobacter sp. SW132]REL32800.1 hypothetical protein DYD21_13305 [Rhodohalobacter sp. SW132]
MFREIFHFILHLRLHYQFLILSGGYLLGGFMAGEMNTQQFWMQFLNVHILLFGGATAYNSFWDKDTGPIGGLKNPPKMTQWMHPVSILFMFAGLILSLWVGLLYALVYFISLVLFWLYSTPLARWKGDPILSLIAIGISTGMASVLLGNLAAGGAISWPVLLSSVGATFILLSLYPVSQIFQMEEDMKRNDRTFAIAFGVTGVKRFFTTSYISGSLILLLSIFWVSPVAAAVLFVGTALSGMFIASFIYRMTGDADEYAVVMKTKFFASLLFVSFFLVGNFIRHGWIT